VEVRGDPRTDGFMPRHLSFDSFSRKGRSKEAGKTNKPPKKGKKQKMFLSTIFAFRGGKKGDHTPTEHMRIRWQKKNGSKF